MRDLTQNLKQIQSASEKLSKQYGHCIGPEETHLDAKDRLFRRLDNIHSQLVMMTGEGWDQFRSLNPNLQDSYVYGIQVLVCAVIADAHIVADCAKSASASDD